MSSILFYLMTWLLLAADANGRTTMLTANITIKPDCPKTCGNLTIPYPFGIGPDCSLTPFYSLMCNTTLNPPKAFLINPNAQIVSDKPRAIHEIVNISESQLRIRNKVVYYCYNRKKNIQKSNEQGMLLPPNSPFVFSSVANKIITVGCGYTTNVSGNGHKQSFLGSSYCHNAEEVYAGDCLTLNGCGTDVISNGLTEFYFSVAIPNVEPIAYDHCGYGFIGEVDAFKFQGLSDLSKPNVKVFLNRTLQNVHLVVDWVIGNETCEEAKKNLSSYRCHRQNTTCVDPGNGIRGYRCDCIPGNEGNPYLPPGCTAEIIKEIKKCSLGLEVDGGSCVLMFSIKLVIGLGISLLSSAIGITWIYLMIRKQRILRLKEKMFTKNGGLLLKGQLSSMSQGGIEPIKIFTVTELKMATNNFSDDCITGRGGSGIVYKGLLEDKSLIAIKKAIIVDENQIDQFINELVILSQINHRNVVKLLGCCLEVEVPLLIYEFIPNGALFNHIHNGVDGSWLDWSNRLRIISEIANALAYLHSSAIFPIIHRDIKSANVLLDDNYTSKVSDFGASRLILVGQTKLSTAVQGTLGYLDPEYMFSSELTEKSDVYSFGVLVAEILTRKKAVFSVKGAIFRNLATSFVELLKKGKITLILDPQLVENARIEEVMFIAAIVGQCLSSKGEDRPAMKDVAAQLDRIANQVLADD